MNQEMRWDKCICRIELWYYGNQWCPENISMGDQLENFKWQVG